jgi:type I restriction enzyme, S subunit
MEVKTGDKQAKARWAPEAWDAVTLGTLVSLKRGHDLPARARREGNVPVMSAAGQSGFHDTAIARGPGVVLGRSGASFGRAHYCEQDFWPHNTALYVTDFRGNDPRFVFHLLSIVDFSRHNSGGAQQSLNRNFIALIPLRLPRPSEQRAIAAALGDADALLAGLDRLIAKKRDLVQAGMQQLLTGQTRLPGFSGAWEETNLGTIGECIIGLTYRPEDVVEHGLLVLRASNIQDGRLAYDDNVHVSIRVPDHLVTRAGDILVCVRNGSRALIGKCAVIDDAAAGLTFGAFMSVYRTRYWRFIAHAFQTHGIQRQIRDNIGATINQITNKDMRALRVKLPPEDEQSVIAAVLADMGAELLALEQRREKTRALKQAMMQELLTGKTRLV